MDDVDMIPWPFQIKTDLNSDEAMLKLKHEVEEDHGLAGSRFDFLGRSFWIRGPLEPMQISPGQFRLSFQYYLSGKMRSELGPTVVSGWVVPGVGAVLFGLSSAAFLIHLGIQAATDVMEQGDWVLSAVWVVFVAIWALLSLAGIRPVIRFLRKSIERPSGSSEL